MKTFLAILVLSLPFRLMAAEGEFDKKKTEILSHIDERVKQMQEHRSCVAAATDHDGLKKCHEKMEEWRKNERLEHMEMRKGRMEERMKKMNEKMNEKK